jgi:hypothetical protein
MPVDLELVAMRRLVVPDLAVHPLLLGTRKGTRKGDT